MSPLNEAEFKRWYSTKAQQQGLNPDPDAPEHFYDYRAAFAAGAGPDFTGHWPSQFKREGHPRLVIDGVDTRTGMPSNDGWVDDEEGWVDDEEALSDFSDVQAGTSGIDIAARRADPFGYQRTGTSLAKGLGQGVYNLGSTAKEVAMGRYLAPPPEMPEALRTEPGDLAAATGRLAPSLAAALAAPATLPASLATGALGGAMTGGTPTSAALGAGGGAGFHALGAGGQMLAANASPIVKQIGERLPGAVVGGLGGMAFGDNWKTAVLGALTGGSLRGSKVAELMGFGPKPKEPLGRAMSGAADEAKALLAARRSAEETAEGLGQGSFNTNPFDEVDAAIAERFPPPPAGADKLASATRTSPPHNRTYEGRTAKAAGKDRVFRKTNTSPTAIADVDPAPPTPPEARASATSTLKPGPAFPPPPGMGASTPPAATSTTSSTTVPVPAKAAGKTPAKPDKPAAAPKPKEEAPPPDDRDDLLDRLRGSIDKPSRGNVIREGRKGGKSREDVGAALSDATNKPLDPDDLTEATTFLKAVGDYEEALRIIRDHPDNTTQDVIRLSRAVREAHRRGGKGAK